jgi:hypothetical protein
MRQDGRWESISRTFLGLFWGCCSHALADAVRGSTSNGLGRFQLLIPYKVAVTARLDET